MFRALGRLLSPVIGAGPPDDLAWITPRIACSSSFASRAASALPRLSIGAVLDLRAAERHRLAPLGKAGLHYLHIAARDDELPTHEELARAADWVRQELGDDRKVLVHYQPSPSSSVVVIGAVLLSIGYPLVDVVPLLQRRTSTTVDGPAAELLQRYAASIGR